MTSVENTRTIRLVSQSRLFFTVLTITRSFIFQHSRFHQLKAHTFRAKDGTPFNGFCSPKGVEISCIVLPKHSNFEEHFGNQTVEDWIDSHLLVSTKFITLFPCSKAMSSSTAGPARASLYRQYSRGSSGGGSSSSIENLPPRTLSRVAREVRDLIKCPPEGIRLVVDIETGLPTNLGEIVVSCMPNIQGAQLGGR